MTAWYNIMRTRDELFTADLIKYTCWCSIEDVLTINKRYNPSVYWHRDSDKLFLAKQLDKLFRKHNLPNRVWPSLPKTAVEEKLGAFRRAIAVLDITEKMYDLRLWSEERALDNVNLVKRYLLLYGG